MIKSKPFYIKLIGRHDNMLDFWQYNTLQEAVDKYFYITGFLKDYDAWRVECDKATEEKINKQKYL